MGESMSIRAAGRRIGVSHVTLIKAIESGRLREAVSRDAKGHLQVDPEIARRELEATRGRPPFPRAAPRSPCSAGEGETQAVELLKRLVAQDRADATVLIQGLVPHVIAGAAEALSEATGRPPSLADLVDALWLGGEDGGIDALVALTAMVDDGTGPTSGSQALDARNAGRRLVLEHKEARHGGQER